MAEVLKTAKLDLKKSIVSSSVFSAASSNIASSISPMIPFGGVAKAIGSQPKSLEIDKIDVPKPSPFADIVAQLQVKFESLSSSVRANYRDIKSLKKFVKSEKKEKDNSLEETNQILEDIGQALALDFANRVTEKKEKLDLLRDSILKKRVEDEEQELEKGAKNTKETNKKLDKVIAPAKGIFSSILEFFALLGTAILAKTAFTWLEDPKNREKLAGIFTWLTEHWKWIVGGLAIGGLVLALAPLVGLIGGIAGALGLVGSALSLLAPFALPILAIAAVAAAGWFGSRWLKKQDQKIVTSLHGGQEFKDARDRVDANLGLGHENQRGIFFNERRDLGDNLLMVDNPAFDYLGVSQDNTGYIFKKGLNGKPERILGDSYNVNQDVVKSGMAQTVFSKVKANNERGWDWKYPKHRAVWLQRKGKIKEIDEIQKAMDNKISLATNEFWDLKKQEAKELGIFNSMDDGYQEFVNKAKEELKIIQQGIRNEFTPLLQRFHGGGTVIGESGIDKIAVRLTHGEEVINKESADKFRYVLKDINDNSGKMWLAFQEGVKIQSEINKDNKKVISNLAATLNVLQKQTNNLVEYESNNKSLENTLLPNTFLSSSKKEEKGDGDKNWIQKFWEWFVPPAEKSNEPSVRAGVRTSQTGFSHVESMSGGTQLFGSPSTKDVSSNLKRQKTNIQVVNQTNVGDGVSVDTGTGNNTGVVPAKQGSSGKDIQIFPYDVENSWILEAVYAYEIASPVGSVVGPQE